MVKQARLFDEPDVLTEAARAAYSGKPGFKEKEGTSQAAAESMSIKAATLRQLVMVVLQKHGPHTADEIAERLGQDILGIRPRLSELFNANLIKKTGERRPSSRGKSSVVWGVI